MPTALVSDAWFFYEACGSWRRGQSRFSEDRSVHSEATIVFAVALFLSRHLAKVKIRPPFVGPLCRIAVSLHFNSDRDSTRFSIGEKGPAVVPLKQTLENRSA